MREGLDRFALEPRARERQNFLGRAFDRHEPLRRALLVNGRHPVLAVTTRSQLLQRILPAEPPTIDAEVERRGEERGLRGAAPDVLRVLGDLGLVAEDTDGERARQKLIGLVVAPRALRRGQVLAATEMPRGGGHTVFRERARLVETDHGRRAEALDRRQTAYEHPPLHHAVHSERQGGGGDGRQALGDRGDGERQRRPDHLDRRNAAQEPEAERESAEAQRSRDELAAHVIQLPLERRRRRRCLGHERADASDLGLAAGADDDRDAGTFRHDGGGEHHVEPVGQRRLGTTDQRRDLRDRHALPGQGRLVDGQMLDVDETRVGRNRVAGLEEHDVARHQLVGGHDVFAAVAKDERRRQAAVLERGEDTLDTALGDVADDAVGGDHRADDHRVDHGTHAEREHGGGAEQEHGQGGHVAGEDLERGLGRRRGQRVLAEGRASPGDVDRVESRIGIRAELSDDGRRGQRVPDAVDSRQRPPLTVANLARMAGDRGDQGPELEPPGVEQDEDVAGG